MSGFATLEMHRRVLEDIEELERVVYKLEGLPAEWKLDLHRFEQAMRQLAADIQSFVSGRTEETNRRIDALMREALEQGNRLSSLERAATSAQRELAQLRRELRQLHESVGELGRENIALLDVVKDNTAKVLAMNGAFDEINRTLNTILTRLPPGPEPAC